MGKHSEEKYEKIENIKSKKYEKNSKKKSRGKKALWIILIILIVLVVIGYVLYQVFIGNKLGEMNYKKLNMSEEELGVSEEKTKASDYRNIAILGVDSRFNSYEDFARTDCIMIASINKKTSDIKLFSIYRDTLVQMDIDGTTRLDKINHAYYNGVENTLKTINTNFDLNVSEYINVDFEAVADMVNAVGGVEINITSDELKYINGYIDGNNKANDSSSKHITKAGTQKLDGNQALAYGRIRYTEGGDFKRTERMRTVLSKVFEKLKGKSVTELYSIMDIILPKVQTNISKSEMVSLAPKLVNTNISDTFGFPYNAVSEQLDLKDYYNGTVKGKDYYDVPTKLTEDVEKLHKEVLEEKNYTVPSSINEIYEQIKTTAKIK